MTEIELVQCNGCGEVIENEYKHITIKESNEEAETIEDEKILKHPKIETHSYAVTSDLNFNLPDKSVNIDLCLECYSEVENIYQELVDKINEMNI